MCRLLAYASRTPVTLTDLFGDGELAEFVELSKTHCDGWGLAYAQTEGVGYIRVPEPAHSSPEFVEVSQEHRSDLAIAHVRWATDDLAIDLLNTHPFSNGRLAFAHNGAIRPPRRGNGRHRRQRGRLHQPQRDARDRHRARRGEPLPPRVRARARRRA